MSKYVDQDNPYASFGYGDVAALAAETERTSFIRRTYLHLAGAVGLFIALETLFFSVLPAETLNQITRTMFGGYAWLLIIGGFMFISWIANSWAANPGSQAKQYAGLLLYVVAQSVLFIPLLWLAQIQDPSGHIIPAAGALTGIIFVGLTAMVFITRADFSWIGRYLMMACFLGLGLIICSVFFNLAPFTLAILGFFIAIACGYILYDTSNVMLHYNTNQHVAAALALFASVALLFWNILQLLMRLQSRD